MVEKNRLEGTAESYHQALTDLVKQTTAVVRQYPPVINPSRFTAVLTANIQINDKIKYMYVKVRDIQGITKWIGLLVSLSSHQIPGVLLSP